MIERTLAIKARSMAEKFPVVTVTGCRQCGKSTLLKACFPDYTYVSLEDRDVQEFASQDPRGFLSMYANHIILDEVQQVPELFSYLQTHVDSSNECGQYILSGSHNFLLMESISQSLAGRTAVLKLFPFSIDEMKEGGVLPADVFSQMYTGGYPRIYDKQIDPEDFFPSYIETYLERDVRLIRNITNRSVFVRFLQLCAVRSGQILNLTSLASDAGVSVPTARDWLSVLETSYIIFLLKPYYNNFSKRLVKSPKLYFYDNGLLCHLLHLTTAEGVASSEGRGAVFENMVISDFLKRNYFQGREPACYFWRDTAGNEVDLLTERNGCLEAYEIKLAETMNSSYLNTLHKFSSWTGLPDDRIHCIYRGKTAKTSYGEFLNYMDVRD